MKEWSPPEPIEVLDLWRKADQYLVKERRDYWLNGSYYLGHQWVWWDFTRNLLQELDYANDAERSTRITVDKFGPRTGNLLSRLIRAELFFEVQPQGTDDSSMRRQRLQEQLLIAEQHERDWELTREVAVLQTLFVCRHCLVVRQQSPLNGTPITAKNITPTWNQAFLFLPVEYALRLLALTSLLSSLVLRTQWTHVIGSSAQACRPNKSRSVTNWIGCQALTLKQ